MEARRDWGPTHMARTCSSFRDGIYLPRYRRFRCSRFAGRVCGLVKLLEFMAARSDTALQVLYSGHAWSDGKSGVWGCGAMAVLTKRRLFPFLSCHYMARTTETRRRWRGRDRSCFRKGDVPVIVLIIIFVIGYECLFH